MINTIRLVSTIVFIGLSETNTIGYIPQRTELESKAQAAMGPAVLVDRLAIGLGQQAKGTEILVGNLLRKASEPCTVRRREKADGHDVLLASNVRLPGAAERIMRMAEHQAQHRQDLEARVIRTDNLKSLLGMVFGFVIALVGFGGGLYTAFAGQPFWGGAVSISTLASVVIAFIYGTRVRARHLQGR